MNKWLGVAVALGATVTAGACAHDVRPESFVASRAVVRVQGRWLSLRVSQPSRSAETRPLVLFITGDGGWRGKDLEAFGRLLTWGYPVAGVSAPDYLGHLAGDASLLPQQVLADDIAAIVGAARQSLRLPAETHVLLVGVSRGADLAVVAAAWPSLRRKIQGVLAVGLTKEEEYVRRRRVRPAAADGASQIARPYVALRRVAAPVCVIQSTHDEYVPAADARTLFGPDSPSRLFHAIESRNHSFSDSREVLYDVMRASLQWVESHGADLAAQ